MNKYRFDCLMNDDSEAGFSLVDCLLDKTPRTLLYGKTEHGGVHHCYLGDDGSIHTIHHWDGFIEAFVYVQKAADYIREVRMLYPHACDFEFCKVLKRHNVDLPFITGVFEKCDGRAFYSKTAEELEK